MFMKLKTPFTILNNSLNDVWRMQNFNYQSPKDPTKEYWDEECIFHPTNSHCKIFNEQLNKNKIYIEFYFKILPGTGQCPQAPGAEASF